MSTNRISPEAGWTNGCKRPDCRNCGGSITDKARRTFCSDACVHEWKIKTQPGYVRELVDQRDHGVCAECRLDTEKLRESLATLGFLEKRARTKDLGFHVGISFWAADHIVPVVEGGGECGLENYRTLCVPCHRQVTRELHRRLKEKRTGQPSLPGVPA